MPTPPPYRQFTTSSAEQIVSSTSGQSRYTGQSQGLPLHFCAPHNPSTAYPQYKPFNNTQTVGANLVFALIIIGFVPFNKIMFALILHSHFVLRTKQIGLRAETGTRLCESERRKTSNCLSRRRVFDVQRTSTFSGSARCVEP